MGRWKNRPAGSTWGDFGEEDQLGRLNLLDVRRGVAEAREGRAFCLSLPLDFPGEAKLNLRRGPPQLRPTEHAGVPFMNRPLSAVDERATDVICDDQVTLCTQYSTQWDGFAHVGAWFDADGDGVAEKVYYNGYRAHEDILGPDELGEGRSAARALGIEHFAARPIQGRGVLVDLHALFGRERIFVGYDELRRAMDASGASLESGDILVLHTGFAEIVLEMDRRPDMAVLDRSCAVLDGRDPRLLQLISDSGVAAICADNYAVEGYPARPVDGKRANLPLHEHCLFKLGVPLGELWWLGELAAWLRENRRSRFLLTAPPLRLPGAVGSPVTPVATV